MHPHRILSLLFLLLLSLALGACASHDARPAPEPGAPLPAVTLERGDRVFIKIENGKSMTEDLHSMLTAYLQSERGLNPASDVKEADLVILVEIRDVWATSDGSRVSAGRTLGNVGTGTMLGVLLGSLVDGRAASAVRARAPSAPRWAWAPPCTTRATATPAGPWKPPWARPPAASPTRTACTPLP